MLQARKAESVGELKGRFERMTSAVFLDFTGMTVAEVTDLRQKFRARGVEYRVVKNTLVRQALKDQAWAQGLDAALAGMTGIAWSFEEPSAAARVVKEFCKDNEKLRIKAGLLEGQVLGPSAVTDQLALLPSKDEARARLLATLMAPARNLVMLMNAPAREFVGVLMAKARKAGG